jgi:phosphatidylglycerophosphate synthase
MRTLAELRSVAQAGKMTDPSWYRVHRALSIHVTLVALKMGLEANRVSMLMMATTLCAAALLASRAGWLNVLGFALGYAGFLLDKVDGEVARLRGRLSMRGILLDRLHHRLVEPTLLLAVGWHEYQLTGSVIMLVSGFAAMVLGNAIDEHQHLGPVVLHKHLRQGGALPEGPGVPPSAVLARLHRLLRPLKTARTVALSLPLAASAYAAERWLGYPVPGVCLELGALALALFLAFQCAALWVEGVEREAAEVADMMRHACAKARAAAGGFKDGKEEPAL